jgi:hypothetical protein
MSTSRNNRAPIFSVLALAVPLALMAAAPARAASFVYEGRLEEFGRPANGLYDIRIGAFAGANSGVRLAEAISFENVRVENGRFQLQFELPLVAAREAWLELAVRAGEESSAHVPIPGRSKAEPQGAIGACWSSTGDLGTNPLTHFIGTRDNQPLLVRSNNLPVARFAPNGSSLYSAPLDGSGIELVIGADASPPSEFANLYLKTSDGGLDEGILISAGGELSGQNAAGLYIDQYSHSNAAQTRRFSIEPSGMIRVPGPGIEFGATTRQMLNLWGPPGGPGLYGIGVQSSTQYFRSDLGGNFAWFTGGGHSNTLGDPGPSGQRPMFLNGNGQLELANNHATASPRLRLSFGGTGVLANRYWDFIASRAQLSPGGPAIPAGSLILADDVGLKAAFDINGLARNQSGTWTSWSDARLKTGLRDIEAPLDTLLAMRGQWFEYRDPKSVMARPGPRMGLIAQDVQKAVPEWVSADERGYLSITPTGFEALTVEALRELRAEGATLDALQAEEIQQLKSENQTLRQRLERIEALLARP